MHALLRHRAGHPDWRTKVVCLDAPSADMWAARLSALTQHHICCDIPQISATLQARIPPAVNEKKCGGTSQQEMVH
jgi:hypothetical protein